MKKEFFKESALATLAKKYRKQSGNNKAEVARELDVNKSTIQLAEENPEQSLAKLRIRMIEKYSPYKVTGPFYILEKK